jgi:hypothetical protein
MAKCPEVVAVKISTDVLDAGRRQADANDGRPSSRAVLEALQRPLTLGFRRHTFRGPAWAVLCAYAMFLTAGAFLIVAGFVAAQFLEPSVVGYVLTVGKGLLLSP